VTDDSAGRTPATQRDGPGSGFERLTEETLPALIARLRASRLGEIEVRTGEWRVRLRRGAAAGARGSRPAADGGGEAPDGPPGIVARSTAVGYFTPTPELVVGRSVQLGDVLGTIDVLGIAQEVTAPGDGMVSSILAEDGQAVEFGQALAEIDPLELELGAGASEDVA
jgi:acetyl-CoA carboxylase biotin carboxyl carrier protein